MSALEHEVNSSVGKVEQEIPSNFLLDNLGQFADGTPFSVESVKNWRQQSLSAKIEQNNAYLDRLTVSWSFLCRRAISLPLSNPSDLLLEEVSDVLNVPDAEVPIWSQSTSESNATPVRPVAEKLGVRPVTIFLHVPKAGGTTLEYILGKNYSINRSIHVNAPELEKKPYLLFKHNALPALVMGHHKISSILYQLIDRPIIHLTMLRDPILRAISYYDYRRSGTRHKLYEIVRGMTLREFIESGQFIELENAQSRRLLGTLQNNREDVKSKYVEMSDSEMVDMLDAAKQALHNRISLFGITEEYTRFLLMGKRMLGWTDLYYNRRNISQQKTKIADVEPSVIDLLRQQNQVDIALYDYAKQLFGERCSQLEITQEKVDQHEALNATYQELLSSAKQIFPKASPDLSTNS